MLAPRDSVYLAQCMGVFPRKDPSAAPAVVSRKSLN
ncbi:protein of unknown function [Nitrospira japonica]|uniref:Uncharacterized protein n=1 Tax=Nitrospira japonica TaxID=1325564 RepID=A0A1W1I8E2_9BACT|nr:protein of unknown function [Nitrospira japonica]